MGKVGHGDQRTWEDSDEEGEAGVAVVVGHPEHGAWAT